MKYTIESTENGCIETLTLSNGKQYTKSHICNTHFGHRTLDEKFYEQMEKDGVCEEMLDIVCDTFDSFPTFYFKDIANMKRMEDGNGQV